MLTKRVPLLSVFAGGCLSGAVAVALLRGNAQPPVNAGPAAHAQQAAAVPLPATPADATEASVPEAAAAPAPDPTSETRLTGAPRPTSAVTSQQSAAIDGGDEAAPGPTRSVADILLHLESAYRQQLTETARVAAPPAASATPPAEVAVREPPAPEQAPIAAALAGALPTSAKESETPAARPRELEPPPPIALREASAGASVVYTGNVQQNIHVGDVVQTDVYQLQQLAVLQYLQLLALSPHSRFTSPAAPVRGAGTRERGVRHAPSRSKPAFPSSITNPENPWGFSFPPPMLAK
jgi:hypothetical protein